MHKVTGHVLAENRDGFLLQHPAVIQTEWDAETQQARVKFVEIALVEERYLLYRVGCRGEAVITEPQIVAAYSQFHSTRENPQSPTNEKE